MSDQKPVLTPPSEAEMTFPQATSQPDDAILAELAATAEEAPEEMAEAPTERAEDAESGQEAGASIWYKNKKVSALWSINQNRNVYMALAGVGWKKLADNNDSCVVALNTLAANAKLGNRIVSAREDNGEIVEMYVW